MIRRCRTSLTVAALVALGVSVTTGRARASGMATYTFTNTTSGSITQILAQIQPAGSIAASTPSVSPLVVLTGGSGFDQTAVNDSLGSGFLDAAKKDPLEVLEIDFKGAGGLAPGGTINFSLNYAPSYNGLAPSLMVESPAGQSFQLYTPPTTGTSGSGSTGTDTGSGGGSGPTGVNTNAVPEPLSLTLWSVAAGLGLLRARAFRRAHRVEA